MRHRIWLASLAVIIPCSWWLVAAEAPPPKKDRTMAARQMKDGQFKDAYESYRALVLDPKADELETPHDLRNAVEALRRLGRIGEVDELLESAIAAHRQNWRLLRTAAQLYAEIDQFGFIVAGKFERGRNRGNARFVNTYERDRVRALQLMADAVAASRDVPEKNKPEVADLYEEFARLILRNRGYTEAWRLQVLTNLKELPDYQEGWFYNRGETRGAPVQEDGRTPVYYEVPKSWEAATSDGERWRWLQTMAAELNPSRQPTLRLAYADFLNSQFGVETLAQWSSWGRADDDKGNESGTYALQTLTDDETIARLATGIKRFKLPDDFNPLKIYQDLAKSQSGNDVGQQASERIAGTFENRRQYVRAAEAWKSCIQKYGPGPDGVRSLRLEQIVGNWGRFEPGAPQPAGPGATVDFRFRNGKRVEFEAREIDVSKLITDVKAYLKSSPRQLDWQKMNVQEIGYRIVTENQSQYLGRVAAQWSLDLKPREAHVDDRVTVATPMQKAGAYLVTAKMAGGNVSRIIVWVADLALVQKSLTSGSWFYVADATTGQPAANAQIEFFGWKQEQVAPNTNNYRVRTVNLTETANADGQLTIGADKISQEFQWIQIARTADNRLAYMGFNGIWYPSYYDAEYNETKVFSITDRPVYRPDQPVKFKLWIGHAKYDLHDQLSEYANQNFVLRLTDPQGQEVFKRSLKADKYGGISGEYALPKNAMLGSYSLMIEQFGSGGSFRVEEYKKPEFEVVIDAPKEPVKLGEKVTAKVTAKYYFGSPVAEGRVKYKILRSNYSSTWYPRGRWDWMYGSGYWWFAPDYRWYPGWNRWGCARPIGWWWGHAQPQPELLVENEVDLRPDGTIEIEIDTLPAKELLGNSDHKYSITAEVVDASRRTIVGSGDVLVAREPFRVFAWVDQGYYRTGDPVLAEFEAHTLDQKPVTGTGRLTLYRITYDAQQNPIEEKVEQWELNPNDEGRAQQQFKAGAPGQYRLSYDVKDAAGHEQQGGYLFTVRGEAFNGREFRFNDLELITDKREYAPGDKVRLMINTNRSGAAVVLFLRPANGVYLPPKLIRMTGKSTVEEIGVVLKDMPNFFIEAVTVHSAKAFSETREIVVPPAKRVLNVEVAADQAEYLPGAEAKLKVRLTELDGKPFVGSTVLTMYDRSLEYISGGSNVPEIRDFFWKWRRQHSPRTTSSLDRGFGNLLKNGERGMNNLGLFGDNVVEEFGLPGKQQLMTKSFRRAGALAEAEDRAMPMPAPASAAAKDAAGGLEMNSALGFGGGAGGGPGAAEGAAPLVQPTIRSKFADAAFWAADLETDKDGFARVSLTMPENLTAWKIKAWGLGLGTRVGEGEASVVTRKNLLVRLQAPRFFVQKDEVVLSANVHNYLKTEKQVQVSIELEGNVFASPEQPQQMVTIPAGGETRVDWRVTVVREGLAKVRMKALSDEESDAMEMTFPAYVHGLLKTESWANVVRPDAAAGLVKFTVPEERRPENTRLEVRYSPTLAGAMVDALPYLVEYPYGCTEQTLNRFLPTVITQKILLGMKLDLAEIQKKRTNLNAQEIGDDAERAAQWKRYDRNPVFDVAEVQSMVTTGVTALQNMQLSDGGWGWFSGYGEHSYPHTTATVVHGLQVARSNDVAIAPGVIERGVEWLKRYQSSQVQELKNAEQKIQPWKRLADATDALVYSVLADADVADKEMQEFLYRDRIELPVYAKALFGLALQKQQQQDKLNMILENIGQFVVQDEENETAWLKLPENNAWWYWYGSEIEAEASYLKLLTRTDPKGKLASRLVKYLLNNRKHATYWNSTRDTSLVIEAMAEFLRASGEDRPDMTIEVVLDGKVQKEVVITPENLFSFDNQFVLEGADLTTGEHQLEIRRKGTGPVYFNTYLTNFTLEDFITKAGLEVKVERKYYRLKRVDKQIDAAGQRGQAIKQNVEKYEREALQNLAQLRSGDLVEIELEIDSKNDYEYVCFEDQKAAGFEPVEVRSGYNGNDLGAFIEFRDERVCFFVRRLARGKQSVSYRLRAEIPGRFSALPTRAYAMYAPELKANSDEIKLLIEDRKDVGPKAAAEAGDKKE